MSDWGSLKNANQQLEEDSNVSNIHTKVLSLWKNKPKRLIGASNVFAKWHVPNCKCMSKENPSGIVKSPRKAFSRHNQLLSTLPPMRHRSLVTAKHFLFVTLNLNETQLQFRSADHRHWREDDCRGKWEDKRNAHDKQLWLICLFFGPAKMIAPQLPVVFDQICLESCPVFFFARRYSFLFL